MSNTLTKKLVHKSAGMLRPQFLADLRRNARRAINTSDIAEKKLTGSGESHRIPKQSVTLRLDRDVLQYFRSQGAGYQTRINETLRAAIHAPKATRQRLREAARLLNQLAAQKDM